MLADRAWSTDYDRDDGDLVGRFYIPALREAIRYDRTTGFFSAGALTLAARGIEGLLANGGTMRLVVGCTLQPAEIAAIRRGEDPREKAALRLAASPLDPAGQRSVDALELLAWMVAKGHLEVKVAVPCDDAGTPTDGGALFHEKTGIVEDRDGSRLAWTGSLNETRGGWQNNWESFTVFRSWREPAFVESRDRKFRTLWEGRTQRLLVMPVPQAVREDLFRFLPKDDRLPKRFPEPEPDPPAPDPSPTPEPPVPAPPRPPPPDRRALVWGSCGTRPARRTRRSAKPPRRSSPGRTRRAPSTGCGTAGRRGCSSPTKWGSARRSRPGCCCARRGSAAGRSASWSSPRRRCSASGGSNSGRSST